MIEIDTAREIINSHSFQLGTEVVCISEASGRVLAEECFSDRDYPPFHRATMDGFAVSSRHYSRRKDFRIVGTIQAGALGDMNFPDSECVKIMTGARVPDNFDLVIRVEDSIVQGERVAFEVDPVKPYMNIALKGEDIKKNSPILQSGSMLNPLAISLLASIGKEAVKVFQPPKVSILSTGNEIIPLTKEPMPEQIRDSNSYTLIEFLKRYHINPVQREILPDVPEKISDGIERSLDSEVVIISGGVSMGEFDFVPKILSEKKVKNLFHKVEIKPGKPFWFGVGPKGTAVFALPGNPFAVQVAFKVFIEPFLRKIFHLPEIKPLKIPLMGSRSKKHNLPEYFPAKIDSSGEFTGILAVEFNGSGDITAASKSDGIALHRKEKQALCDGDIIQFYSWTA